MYPAIAGKATVHAVRLHLFKNQQWSKTTAVRIRQGPLWSFIL